MFMVILGFSFGWIARELWVVKEEQRAIAKALFARIPLRDPTEQEIEKAAKEEIDWLTGDQGRYRTPTESINNTMIRQCVRDRLYAKQFAPKLD